MRTPSASGRWQIANRELARSLSAMYAECLRGTTPTPEQLDKFVSSLIEQRPQLVDPLREVTVVENDARAESRFRYGSEQDKRIRKLFKQGLTVAQIAARYGRSANQISRIVKGVAGD